MIDLLGQILDGRYALTYRIHVGGIATVYLARDQFLRRSVVLKVLHPALATAPAYVERFRREACVAASLSHPNLISVYNLGACAGTYYIVMEHVTGPSLGQSLQIGGRISEVRALQITAQVAAALAAAHERGIAHGDVRSHNILLAAHGQVKITDFGCAQTATGDGRADLYHLGLMLHEMLTGSQTMPAGTMAPAAWARLRLSPWTDAIVRRALAPDAAFRFPTAEAMRAASESALSQIAIEASRPDHSRARAAHSVDRQPRIGLLDLLRPRSTRLAS